MTKERLEELRERAQLERELLSGDCGDLFDYIDELRAKENVYKQTVKALFDGINQLEIILRPHKIIKPLDLLSQDNVNFDETRWN